jgi:dienelactone hydrolase
VFRRGTGPAVIVIAELPGITPKVLEFADRVVDIGCTAVLPHLFGWPGFDVNNASRATQARYMLSSIGPACISREFANWSTGRTSPCVDWLRALARTEHRRCGGPGVGAIGMCFTGGFALASAVEPAVLAAVGSQPSVPFPISAAHRRDLGMSEREQAVVAERVRTEDVCLVGLRFSEDSASPGARFAELEKAFGPGWRAIPLNSEPGNPHGIGRREHSVLTSADVETPGHPTHEARAQVTAFLRHRLLGEPDTER